MKKVSVFLADGFEEIEGLTVVDLLRRAGIIVSTVSITGNQMIHGAHGIDVAADVLFENSNAGEADMLVLPGGQPGTSHLKEHAQLKQLLRRYDNQHKYIAAICAAPSILGEMGILNKRKATSFPAVEEQLTGASVSHQPVVVDDHIITSRGLGTAIDFALKLIEILISEEKADEIGQSIIYRCSEA